ncbi:MAG: bifunctional folylpolyglutamate synthase/dihydrofolate synthase, partial [Gemmatimonadota bacterium]
MTLTYEEAVRFLFPRLSGGKQWSLGPTRQLLQRLGHPERHFHAIHIGGTNGKGSVATLIYRALRAGGVRAGLYTSPHLVEARERMVVDDRPITPEAFARWTEVLLEPVEAADASFFEATTAIAFADFAARGVEVAVVEVGLGGRLDSTNVLTPLVSAVT